MRKPAKPSEKAFVVRGASLSAKARTEIVKSVRLAMSDQLTASGKLRNAPAKVVATNTATGSGKVRFATATAPGNRKSA